jgi:hypothetical protein
MQSCHLCPDGGYFFHPWQHETWPSHFLLAALICLHSTETESCMLELKIVVPQFYSLFFLKQLFVGIYENEFFEFQVRVLKNFENEDRPAMPCSVVYLCISH